MKAAFLLALVFVVAVAKASSTDRPIIGILTLPPEDCATGVHACFPATYVKWLESAGARVVPVVWDTPKEKLDVLFNSLNGLLFTGGAAYLQFNRTFVQTADYMYQKAVNAFRGGDYFPLWGTCLGFELMNILQAHDEAVLSSGFDSENETWPLYFTPYAPTSRFFASAPKEIYNIFATQDVTQNNHVCGVTPKTYQAYSKLSSFFNVLSTNVDRKGVEFVSMIEGKELPFYATQFHPEKNSFNWCRTCAIAHWLDAVKSAQYLADFFVNECRKNSHHFATQAEEEASLIYNYAPVYQGDGMQVYQFK